MLSLIENYYLLLLLLFLVFSLLIYISINYKLCKISETNKIILITKEIEEERKIAAKLKKVPEETLLLSKKTQLKLQAIKVKVLDIDFTLKELF